MVKYFLLTWKHVSGPAVSAFAPTDVPLAQDLVVQLVNSSELPFELTLVKLSPNRNGLQMETEISGVPEIWPDYMPNSLAWPLVSEKLKQIITGHLVHDEDVYWISAVVSCRTDARSYYVPRFSTLHDVLDWEKTTLVPETKHVIRPVFSAAKVGELSLFPLPSQNDLWRITSSLYVNEMLMNEIRKNKITGISFECTKVTE